MARIYKMSWEEYQEIIEYSTQKIKEHDIKFNFVTGIPRGGLVPAVSLSHSLGLDYQDFDMYYEIISIKNTCALVVDDICHGGKTINNMIGRCRDVFSRTGSKIYVLTKNVIYKGEDIWMSGGIVDDDVWIKYPWEQELELSEANKMIEEHTKNT